MSEKRESDQQEQRRANFDELIELGVDPYPHAFERTHTVQDLVSALRRADRRRSSRREQIQTVDRRAHPRDAQLRQGELPRALRRRRRGSRSTSARTRCPSAISRSSSCSISAISSASRAPVPHADQRADDLGVGARVPRQVLPAAAGEVARPERRRDPLPAALPRSHRQPGFAPGVRGPQPGARRAARVPERARLSRGRDADDAADCRRRAGAAVRDASQRARHAALPAHRAGAVSQAPDRRRHRARLRDQPQLPERGDLDAAQPRVHDARVLPGLQRLSRADGDDRGDARRRSRARRSAPTRSRSASTQISLAPPYRRVSLREGARDRGRGQAGRPRSATHDLRDRETRRRAGARVSASSCTPAGAPARSRPRSSSG